MRVHVLCVLSCVVVAVRSVGERKWELWKRTTRETENEWKLQAQATQEWEEKYTTREKEEKAEAMEIELRCAQLGLEARTYVVRIASGKMALTQVRVRNTGGRYAPPVLMVAGLLQSARTWLDAGDAALAVQLARSGHDLWLASERPTAHELGTDALPALTDYILQATGANTLHYIGFSQGGGAFFIMCGQSPAHCAKYNLVITLAPASRMIHTKSKAFRLITRFYERYEKIFNKNGITKTLRKGGLVQSFLGSFCPLPDAINVCETFKNVLDGYNPGSISRDALLRAMSNFSAGTSVHNMAWYSQQMRSKTFRQFDYGPDQNIVHYGTVHAPAYNLSAVTVPTVVFYGKNDGMVDESDVKWLIKRLPNVKKVIEMEDPLWTHFDFILSKNVPTLLYPKVKEILGLYST